MKIIKTLVVTTLLILSHQAFSFSDNIDETVVVSTEKAQTQNFEWGSLITYYSGESFGTKDALSAVAIINPGMEIHPPHAHEEEEYLMILEGNGTWTIKDKDFPASTGDMLYAKPSDLHGLKNTGSTPLKFVVFKWNSKMLKPTVKH